MCPHLALVREQRGKDVEHADVGPIRGNEVEDGIFACLEE